MAQYDALFEPLDIGPITIPNRVVRAPHSTGLSGDALIAYHETRGQNGVGLSTLEATSIHPSAPGALRMWDDSCMPFLDKLATTIRPTGMKMLLQAYHPGAGYAEVAGMPEHWSASPIPNPMAGVIPIAITKAMIDDVVEAFAAAAIRCRDAGLDGIDIHASSGYLLHEFLSPALNKREDDYGGTFENRFRFLREVIEAVKNSVKDSDFAVGVRLPNEDYVPGAITAKQAAKIAATADPLVDYVSLHMGSYWRFHKLIALADDPLGVEMPANEVIAPDLKSPVMVTGRIMTLDHAEHIVKSGAADMVSMVRALIADPELVKKARAGQEDRIRPCIGTNMGCVGQLMSNGVMKCSVNHHAAQELKTAGQDDGRPDTLKKIMVVGGGPGGMEFARLAAKRGHNVELYEATKQLGGQVTIAAKAPHRRDVGTIIPWLAQELDFLQVRVHLNSPVDEHVIREAAPDEIVIATGTTPRTDGFQLTTPGEPVPGHDLPHVYSSWDLLGFGRNAQIEGPAVVYDDTGSFEAISVADVLMEAGAQVTMVSRMDAVGSGLPYPPVTAGAARERLYSGQFDFIGGHFVRAIRDDEIDIGVQFTDRTRTLPAQTVVFVSYNEPNRAVADMAKGTGIPTHMIGDVLGRNSIMNAMHAAANLANRI